MQERKNEMLNLRVTSRRKNWLQRLAVNKNLTMGQWVQVQVVKTMWEAIKDSAEMVATMIAAEYSGIPEKIAVKLNKANEAILIIPAEKQEEFKKCVNEHYLIELKKEMERIGFIGIEEELKDIDADFTMKEWEESQDVPFTNVQSFRYKNGQLIPEENK